MKNGNEKKKTGNKTGKHPGGRPTLYRREYPEQAFKYCLLGATDERLAFLFEVNPDTIHTWKKNHPEFSESLKRGRDIADAEVAKSLYSRALGYSHKAVKIFADPKTGAQIEVPYIKHYPPDPSAAKLWLCNRHRERNSKGILPWTDTQKVEHSGPDSGPIKVERDYSAVSDEMLRKVMVEARAILDMIETTE